MADIVDIFWGINMLSPGIRIKPEISDQMAREIANENTVVSVIGDIFHCVICNRVMFAINMYEISDKGLVFDISKLPDYTPTWKVNPNA